MTWEVHALEPESGRSLSLSTQDAENTFDIEGKYVEVVETERVVHAWYVGRVTIELHDVVDGIEAVLGHDEFPDRDTVGQHAMSWQGALESFEEMLSGP